jgi:hypothetical protein
MSNKNSQNKKQTVSSETKSRWTLLLLTAVTLVHAMYIHEALCQHFYVNILERCNLTNFAQNKQKKT